MVRRPQSNRREVLLAVAAQIFGAWPVPSTLSTENLAPRASLPPRIPPRQTGRHEGSRSSEPNAGQSIRRKAAKPRNFRRVTPVRVLRSPWAADSPGDSPISVSWKSLNKHKSPFPRSWVPVSGGYSAQRTPTEFPCAIFAIWDGVFASATSSDFTNRRRPARSKEKIASASLYRNGSAPTRLEELSHSYCDRHHRSRYRRPYVFTRGPVEVAIRATCAFPGLVKPVEFEGRLLADGCIVAPVPTAIAARIYGGCVLGVSVDSNAASSSSTESVVKLWSASPGFEQERAGAFLVSACGHFA